MYLYIKIEEKNKQSANNKKRGKSRKQNKGKKREKLCTCWVLMTYSRYLFVIIEIYSKGFRDVENDQKN